MYNGDWNYEVASMTMLEETPVEPASDDHKVLHYLCCRDDLASICGSKVSTDHTPFVVENDMPDECIVCVDLWDHTNMCPKHGTCLTNRNING